MKKAFLMVHILHKCWFTFCIQILVNFYHILVSFGQTKPGIFSGKLQFPGGNFLFPDFLPGNVQF